MTELLKKYLAIGFAKGPSEARRLAMRLPKDLKVRHGGSTKRVRELLQTENVESTSVIATEVYNTVIEGSQPARCYRDLISIIPMKSRQKTIPYGATGVYLDEVPEGAEIPILNQNPTPATITAKKYAGRPLCSSELIEDGEVDIIEMNIRYAGEAAENRINKVCHDVMLLASGVEWDTGSTAGAQGTKAIGRALATLKGAGFMGSSAVLEPNAFGLVAADLLPVVANYQTAPGIMEAMAKNVFQLFPGLMVGCYGGTYGGGTWTWAYASDTNIGMIVFDKARAGFLGMRSDISIEKYFDPIKDLKGAKVRVRCGAVATNANAICRVEY